MSTLLSKIFPLGETLSLEAQAFARVKTIEELELLMLHMPQAAIPCREFTDAGLYTREIFIPKGTFAIGHAHTEPFMQVVSKGKMLMFSEGGACDVVEAPFTGGGLPEYRKVGYALEDTVWTTFHVCKEGASEEYVASLIAPSVAYQQYVASEEDRESFTQVLTALGVSKQTADLETLTNLPTVEESMPVEVKISAIHNLGCFATKALQPHDLLLASDGKRKTQLGRFVNHAAIPNCEAIGEGSFLYLRPVCQIKKGEELTLNYLQVQKEVNLCLQ